MTTDSLGHTFDVAVTYGDGGDDKPTRQVDTHQSVKKPLYYMRFNTYLPDDAVKLAYAAVDDIEADDNIVAIDRSIAAPENSPEFIVGEESFVDDDYTSFYRNILITDVYTEEIPSQPIKPLFYRHLLDGDVDTASIYVLDSSFNRINTNTYRIVEHPEYTEAGVLTGDTESVGVYNDLQNSFDDDTGELVAYYVQYVDTSGVTRTVLLNNQEVYREATFDDINWTTLQLKTWVKAYLVRQVGNNYEFTLPTNTSYTVRFEENIRLRVEKPVVDSNELPWFVRITNGAFTHVLGTDLFDYHVPEFSDQQFNPVEPYKFVLGEEITKVGAGLVQLKHAPTALADLPADIIIEDRDGTVLHALTTNTLKVGTEYYQEGVATGAIWNSEKILSYDSRSGLVQLDVVLKDYYNMTATYYYTEEYYEFTLVDLNPLINTDVLENFYVIYLVPEVAANAGLENAIHYLKVGRDGLVKDCSQDEISSEVIGLPYGRPIPGGSASTSTDDSGNAVGALGHEFMVYSGATTGKYDFLREHTLEAPDGFPGAEYPSAGRGGRYLVLAELSVVHQTSVNDTVILDDRQRGGGIKDDYDEEAKLLNPEVAWYGDIGLGGGIPYPGKSSVIVRLPHCLLDTYGGPFTETEINEIVKRHMAFGHYPVIEYYGIVPDLSIQGVSDEGKLTVYWPSEGSECTYNVYYGTGGRFEQHNTSPVADDPAGNTYTLEGLIAGLTYHIYVTATCDNPCGISTILENICGGGGGADIGVGAGGGFGSHEGPASIAIQIKPLPIVPRDDTSALGHEFTVTI
jgi:hypothetical protein